MVRVVDICVVEEWVLGGVEVVGYCNVGGVKSLCYWVLIFLLEEW